MNTGLGHSFKPLAERLIEKCEISKEGCWQWTGAVNANGYASVWDGEKTETASRVSFALFCHAIPDGLFVLHRCDNPRCIKPSHLFLGTQALNVLDRDLKGRAAKVSGALNPSAKLTADQALAIKLSSEPAAALMQRYGVAESTISNIRKGKTWKTL